MEGKLLTKQWTHRAQSCARLLDAIDGCGHVVITSLDKFSISLVPACVVTEGAGCIPSFECECWTSEMKMNTVYIYKCLWKRHMFFGFDLFS